MLRRSFLSFAAASAFAQPARRTSVSIEADKFLINGELVHKGRTWNGHRIEGLLMNSRMIQGVFDDANPETAGRWKYPDTGKWDAERNNREYIAAMTEWRRHGLLGFTIGLQGGSPEGYSKAQPWLNNAFERDGAIKAPFLRRFENILNRADELGMVAIANYFYFGQDERLKDAAAIEQAARDLTLWILRRGYRNVIVDLVNECDNRSYQQASLRAPNVHKLIELVKNTTVGRRRLLVSTSFNGGSAPTDNVIAASDFVLMHGNGVKDPNRIAAMCDAVRKSPAWRPMPILFNEDDHFDFDQPVNNMRKAIESYAGWGYFDPGKNDYNDGYQSMPVDWRINTERKKAFFSFLKEVTGE